MSRWQILLADEQVVIENPNDTSFAIFVNDVLPELVEHLLMKAVSPETLMEAQLQVAKVIAAEDGDDQEVYDRIIENLSVFPNASSALADAGYTAADFYRRVPGLTDAEIAEVQAGTMTIGDLLDRRPAVILRPLLARPQRH